MPPRHLKDSEGFDATAGKEGGWGGQDGGEGLGFCRVRKKLVVRHWILDGERPPEGERLQKAAKRKWDRGAGEEGENPDVEW